MNLAITIPQIFYDVIARVLPGFFLLLIIQLIFMSPEKTLQFISIKDGDFVSSISATIGHFFIFYILGWVLYGIRLFSFKQYAEIMHSTESNDKKHRIGISIIPRRINWLVSILVFKKPSSLEINSSSNSLGEKFQAIRLKHQETGFRILKLRAEAQMLEGTRAAIGYIILAIIACRLGVESITLQEFLKLNHLELKFLELKLLACIVVYYALLRLEWGAWNRYFWNIKTLYPLVCVDNGSVINRRIFHRPIK